MTKIIVELCQNHVGDRNVLARMIKEASEAGADYVKMQSIFSEDLTRRDEFEEGRVAPDGVTLTNKRPYQAEYDRLSKLDLSLDDHKFFIDECKRHRVIPMTTIFARKRIPEVAALPWPERVVKVASYDCPSFSMIAELAKNFDHIIVSTGASHDHEIERAADLLKKSGKRFSLLHCVTSYPNTLEMANLKRMDWLRRHSDETGWSDHTLVERDGLKAAKVAIYLGADYIERHFTVLEKDKTKDGPVSINPAMLKELDRFRKLSKADQREAIDRECPDWQSLLGNETRPLTPTELLNRDYYRGRFASHYGDKVLYNWDD
jgi:sialic acid synthase SpsE